MTTPVSQAYQAPERRRPVPRCGTALIVAIVAVGFAMLALVAAMVGPMDVNPPTSIPDLPPPAPQMTVSDLPSAPPENGSQIDASWLRYVAVVLGALILLGVLYVLLRAIRRRTSRAVTVKPAATPPSTGLALGQVASDAAVDLTSDRSFSFRAAADDIISTWQLLESVAAHAGYRRGDAETPTEFVTSLCSHCTADVAGQMKAVVLPTYHRARFDAEALTRGAASQVRAVVRRVALEWDVRERDHGPVAGDAADHDALQGRNVLPENAEKAPGDWT